MALSATPCVPHAHGSLAWILGYHFRSLGARHGSCSCLAWPFSALLNNFACDTPQTQQTAIHDYLSVCQSRCVVCQYFAYCLSDFSALHRQYIQNISRVFETAANTCLARTLHPCWQTSDSLFQKLRQHLADHMVPTGPHVPCYLPPVLSAISSLLHVAAGFLNQNFRCRLHRTNCPD
jgi:hypothetical protein